MHKMAPNSTPATPYLCRPQLNSVSGSPYTNRRTTNSIPSSPFINRPVGSDEFNFNKTAKV